MQCLRRKLVSLQQSRVLEPLNWPSDSHWNKFAIMLNSATVYQLTAMLNARFESAEATIVAGTVWLEGGCYCIRFKVQIVEAPRSEFMFSSGSSSISDINHALYYLQPRSPRRLFLQEASKLVCTPTLIIFSPNSVFSLYHAYHLAISRITRVRRMSSPRSKILSKAPLSSTFFVSELLLRSCTNLPLKTDFRWGWRCPFAERCLKPTALGEYQSEGVSTC